MYNKTQDERYLKAINNTYIQVKNQPRTAEGNFWHKRIYPNQVWLDGFYMVMPFYTLYTNRYLKQNYQDIISMYQLAEARMFNQELGLYYHGYDASKEIFWANKETGLSQSFWLRSIGWFLCSIVDVYENLEDDAAKQYFKALFKKSITGILRYLDKDSNMFYQVVDKGGEPGNYLETSGSAMVAYSILKGVRLEILDKNYYQIGEAIYDGIAHRYLKAENDSLTLGGICLVAGLGPANNLRRDGTYNYYISEAIVENESKGIAPFIMAYIELKRSRG
jgi:unsaturated rhamnogalacturonyl hydrolase